MNAIHQAVCTLAVKSKLFRNICISKSAWENFQKLWEIERKKRKRSSCSAFVQFRFASIKTS